MKVIGNKSLYNYSFSSLREYTNFDKVLLYAQKSESFPNPIGFVLTTSLQNLQYNAAIKVDLFTKEKLSLPTHIWQSFQSILRYRALLNPATIRKRHFTIGALI